MLEKYNEGTAMLTKIKQMVFIAPVFEGDEDKTRVSRLLNIILLAFLALILVMAVALSMMAESTLTTFLTLMTVGLLAVGALVLMRFGYIRAVSTLFAIGLLVFDTVLVAVSGGTSTPMVVCFLNVPMVAGLLLGERALVIFGALTAAADLGIYWVESRGLLVEPLIVPSQTTGVLVLVGVLALACTLLYLGFKGTNTALARARKSEQEMIESNRELQDIRASLEKRNEDLQAAVEQYGDFMTKVGQGNLSDRLALGLTGTLIIA
jgi:hypothetical protein